MPTPRVIHAATGFNIHYSTGVYPFAACPCSVKRRGNTLLGAKSALRKLQKTSITELGKWACTTKTNAVGDGIRKVPETVRGMDAILVVDPRAAPNDVIST